MSPSYSPLTGLFYTSFAEAPTVYYRGSSAPEYKKGESYVGSSSEPSGDPLIVGVRALDATTGEKRWEHVGMQRRSVAKMGGVLATAGNVVFIGDSDDLVAVDARNGELLWRVNLGGNVAANPVTYAVDGHQHIAIASGEVIFAFRL